MKKQHSFLLIALVLCVVAILSSKMYATGVLYTTTNVGQSQSAILHPQSMKVAATIQDQIATTTVTESFVQNWADSVKVEYGFPLNPSASIDDVRLWIDEVEYQLEISGAPLDTTKSAGGGGSVPNSALQKYFNSRNYTQTCFRLPVVQAVKRSSVIKIQIRIIELLPYSLGLSSYTFPLRTLQDDPAILDTAKKNDFEFRIVVGTGMTLDTAWSSSHPDAHIVIENNNVGLVYGLAGTIAARAAVSLDFALMFRVKQIDIRSAFFSNKPSNEDGHFVFLLRPSMATTLADILPKTFTFIIDVSGSMTGTKIKQAVEAAAYCVSNLNPQDRFNVIAFSTMVGRFQPMPVGATTSNIQSALSYIRSLSAGGGTNLQGAAMSGLEQYSDPNSVNIIIFLTDGVATLDQTLVHNANTNNVRINVFGIGSDVNSQQLSQLASLNNGLSEFISESANTTSIISNFYNRIRNPLWQHLTFTVDPINTYDVLPTLLPDLNVGEQVVIAGRYKTPGDAVITVNANAGGQKVTAQFPVHFSGDSITNTFAPKVWARMRIDYLKSLMTKEAANSQRWLEWKAEIIRLGLRYGIVTEFTTYKDTGTVSDVEEELASDKYTAAAYPNPFSTSTTISYDVYEPAPIRITVFDLQGREVALLLDGQSTTGSFTLPWDGRDSTGQRLSTGVYLCVIRIGGQEHVLRLTLMN